jgi:hypothetical protein
MDPILKDGIVKQPLPGSLLTTFKCVILLCPEIQVGQPLNNLAIGVILKDISLL